MGEAAAGRRRSCRRYDIPVTPKTVLSHAEVQNNLGIKQRGKWDISRLAVDPSMNGAKACGDLLRASVAAVLVGKSDERQCEDRADQYDDCCTQPHALRLIGRHLSQHRRTLARTKLELPAAVGGEGGGVAGSRSMTREPPSSPRLARASIFATEHPVRTIDFPNVNCRRKS
jgi:hypothetical protein